MKVLLHRAQLCAEMTTELWFSERRHWQSILRQQTF